jgi:hypothetical protein
VTRNSISFFSKMLLVTLILSGIFAAARGYLTSIFPDHATMISRLLALLLVLLIGYFVIRPISFYFKIEDTDKRS